MKEFLKKKTVYMAIMAALIALDLITKALARNYLATDTIVIIDGVLELKLAYNLGVAFGMFNKFTFFITIFSTIICAAMIFLFVITPSNKRLRPLNILLSFMIAGAAGNLFDRYVFGYVTDMIYFKLINFPIFNVADSYLTCSVIILAIMLLAYFKEEDFAFLKRKKKTEQEDVE